MDTPNVNERSLAIGGAIGKRAMLYLGILVFAFALLLLVSSSNASAADVYVSGSVNGTWATGDNYFVVSDASVNVGESLTIQPGVNVHFDYGTSLTIYGSLLATSDNDDSPINFTSNATVPAAGDWNGIYFDGAMTPSSEISGAHIEFAVNGVSATDSNVELSNIVISDLSGAGVHLIRGFNVLPDLTITLDNLSFINVTDGIIAQGLDRNLTVAITNCNIVNADNVGISISATDVISTWNLTVKVDIENTDLSALLVGFNNAVVVESIGDLELDITDSSISDANLAGVSALSLNGAVDTSLEELIITNTAVGIDVTSINGLANLDLVNVTISGPNLNQGIFVDANNMVVFNAVNLTVIGADLDGVSAISHNGAVEADISLADIEQIGGSGLLFYSEFDFVGLSLTDSSILGCGLDGVVAQGVLDVNLEFENVIVDGALDGIFALSTDGNVSANFSDIMVMNCETGIRILAPNGWILMDLDPSVVRFAGTGIYLDAIGTVDLSIHDAFVGNATIGIEIHSFDGGINVLLDNVVLGSTDVYGLFADADNSDMMVNSINGTLMTENDETGWYLVTSNGSVSINVEATTFVNGATGILVESSADIDANVVGSSILGTENLGMDLTADMNITLNVEDSVFDGQIAENAQLFNPSMSDGEYIIIQPEPANWTTAYGLTATLPFGFEFNGATYTEVTMSLNGWLAFGSDGSPDPSFVYDFGPGSPNLIAPAQEFWNADDVEMDGYFHGMGYKYDGGLDAVIFQWFVWKASEPQLKNVFEVILYNETGGVEFRYAMMDGYDVASYDFGINMYDGPNWNLNILNASPFDLDFQSVSFSMTTMSDGAAIFAIAGENMVATIGNSSFSHYLGGGVLLVAENGLASIELQGSDFSFIYATSQIMGAFVAAALDNLMTAEVIDCTFDTIATAAIVLFDAPNLGGVDSFVVENNHFTEVIVTTAIVSLITDEDQNDSASYVSDKVFSQNNGTHVGLMAIATIVNADDVAWNIQETDVISDNNFTGEIDPWLLMTLSSTLTVPYLSAIEVELHIGMMNVIFVLNSDVGDNQVTHSVSVSENKLSEGLVSESFGLGQPMNVGAVLVVEMVTLEGEANLTDETNISIVGNKVSAFNAPLASGVEVAIGESLANPIDGLLVSNVNLHFVNNTLSSAYGDSGVGLGFAVMQQLNDGKGEGMLNVDVVATGNVVEGFGEGVFVGVSTSASNLFGDVISSVNALVQENDVFGYNNGIDVVLETSTSFEHYFPPYEQVVTSNATMLIDVEIINNTVSGDNAGIGVDTSAQATEDEFGVFGKASSAITGPVNIMANNVTSNSEASGIEVSSTVTADVGMASALSDVPVKVVNNTIQNNGTGIYVENLASASTQELRFLDQPNAMMMVKLDVMGNTVNSGVGVSIFQNSSATGGESQAILNGSVSIISNTISGADVGISASTEVPLAILQNIITGVTMDGIWLSVSSGMVENNTIEGVGTTEMNDAEGIFIESAGSLTIQGNVIRNVGFDGIHAVYVWDVLITKNTFENIGASGVYLSGDEFTSGNLTISNNTFTNLGDSGVEVNNIDWLYVLNNTMTNVSYYGVEVYQASNVFIENNTMSMMFGGVDLFDASNANIMNNVMSASAAQCGDEETGYGIVIDDASNITVTRNEITGFGNGVEFDNVNNLVFTWNMVIGSLGDGAYFNVDLANISNNVFSGSGSFGVVFENSDHVIFANNEISHSGMDGLLIIGTGTVTLVNGIYVDNGGSAIFTNMTRIHWVINGNTTIENGEIFFVGDLTVMSGGVLTLDGVDFAIANDGDCVSAIEVMAGGKLIMINADVYMAHFGLESMMNDYYEFNVFGTLRMINSAVGGALELYLGANSTVEIETSTIYEMQRNGIHIVDCSPVIISSTIVSNPRNGIYIEGTAAAPQITDCLIANNERGIYATNTKLDSITDNVFALNSEAGIFAEKVSGAIHNNVFLLNNKEIYVIDSNVSVWDNMIGYTPIVQVVAQFVPLLQGLSLGEDVFLPELGLTVSVNMVQNLLLGHTGIYAVDSIVDSRGNQFGMLTTAVQVMNSKLTFNDDIRMNTLIVPYLDNSGIIRNMSLPVPVYDGIVAKNSDVEVNGGMIEVLDDAIFLDNCTGHIAGVTLKAGDFGVYAIHGSNVTIASSTIGKQRADDPSAISVYEWLTVNVKDPWNTTLANVPVTINDSHLVTDADGNAKLLVLVNVETNAGRQNAQPYLVTANFTGVPTTAYPGHASFSPLVLSKSVTMSGPTTVVLVPSVIVRFDLIAHAMDENGKNAVNVTVKVFNAAGQLVAQAQSDANGTAAFEPVSYIKNADGTTDSSMAPYKVTADIGGHTAQASTDLTGNTNLDVKVDPGPQFDYGPAIIIGALAVIMFVAALIAVRRKP